ncbi:dTMP kinase [Hydrogenimonas sp.]
MYLAFEGIDTVGKSTQIQRVAARYPDAVVTKEPGGTPLGQQIRALLLEHETLHPRTEILLFLADRAEHTERIVRPNRGRLILSDRSFLSGLAYATARHKAPLEELLALNRYATDGLFPDAVVLFRIDEASLRERLAQKEADTIEKRGVDYMMRVQRKLVELCDLLELPTLTVDATAPMESITETIISYIEDRP